MGNMIRKKKAARYFRGHPEPEAKKARKLIDLLDDCVNNTLVLVSYNQKYNYNVVYKSTTVEGFEIEIKIKDIGPKK